MTTLRSPSATGSGEWLVLIDRLEARIFRSLAPGAASQLIRSHGHLHATDRSRQPGYFEPLGSVLHGAQSILIVDRVTPASADNAGPFISWLRGSNPEVARRIAGSIPVTNDDCSDAQLLAKGRDFYKRATAAGGA